MYCRVIPCLDTKDGRVVKGVRFRNVRDAGDPEEAALYYQQQGADELVLLDISATEEGRATRLEVVRKVSSVIDIPLTVGGGIATVEQAAAVLEAGADKVSVNSAAVEHPALIQNIANRFGSERLVVAIDAVPRKNGAGWEVVTRGGHDRTGISVVEWAQEAQDLGAGELLLTSLDRDGTKDGYDIPLRAAVTEAVDVPVIASGGAGKLEHFVQAVVGGDASGVLAASLFHFQQVSIAQVKQALAEQNIPVRTEKE